ncbi:MAG TPA: methyltransferase domain-containing protein [Candidatus Acidoferrales bacterium]|nr:methyltransferase domain-containing protein [Candidatus Acidoferrales bacterium]
MNPLRELPALGAAVLLFVAGVSGCARVPGVEVPDVRTPPEVVTEILRLARVGPDDVVYDLGSGDGRIVIAAARDFGARGVGIELDPDLVAESLRNARRARVADRTRFLQQDIFEADISEATVVTLYLSPEVNLRLRPKLLALPPGSRIVSHDFPIGDWKPERMVNFKGPERTHVLSLWIVPPC